jgi:hypothetical protein
MGTRFCGIAVSFVVGNKGVQLTVLSYPETTLISELAGLLRNRVRRYRGMVAGFPSEQCPDSDRNAGRIPAGMLAALARNTHSCLTEFKGYQQFPDFVCI